VIWNLLDGIQVEGGTVRIASLADIEGLGIRTTHAPGDYLVEGDVVAWIEGLRTFIDFKRAGGNCHLDEVDNALEALELGRFDRFVLGHSSEGPLPADLVAKIKEVNLRIDKLNVDRAADGLLLRKIETWDTGRLRTGM
jgi:hypothetical protein